MATVSVVSIFTRGARSSDTAEMRQTRALNDIARCNAVWSSGFPGGWRCNIQFTSRLIIFRDDVTINANTVASVEDPRIISLIQDARTATNNAVAIYVVYLNGNALSGGVSNANGGPYFTFFNNINNYGLLGRVIMTDSTIDSYVLAHESGHVLFGRFEGNVNTLTINDPSNPVPNGHNQDPRNVMFSSTPSEAPLINQAQCNTASQSRVILENVQTNSVANSGLAASNLASGLGVGENAGFATPSIGSCSCCHPHHPDSKNVKRLNRVLNKEIKSYGPCKIQITPIPKKKCKHKHPHK